MDEGYAALGILLVAAFAMTAYFAVGSGTAGAVSQDYLACCCNILTDNGGQHLVRTQIQMHADDCSEACERYSQYGRVFAQKGLCAENP